MKGVYKTIHLASVGEGLAWRETRFTRIKEETTIPVQVCGTESLWWRVKWLWSKSRGHCEGVLNTVYLEWKVLRHKGTSYICTHSVSVYWHPLCASTPLGHSFHTACTHNSEALSQWHLRQGAWPPTSFFMYFYRGYISYLCNLTWSPLTLLVSKVCPCVNLENSGPVLTIWRGRKVDAVLTNHWYSR